MSDKPEILISDGKVAYLGSANNTEYHFKSGNYEYVFFVNYVGPIDMKPYEFGVYKNKEEFDYDGAIMFEEARIVKQLTSYNPKPFLECVKKWFCRGLPDAIVHLVLEVKYDNRVG